MLHFLANLMIYLVFKHLEKYTPLCNALKRLAVCNDLQSNFLQVNFEFLDYSNCKSFELVAVIVSLCWHYFAVHVVDGMDLVFLEIFRRSTFAVDLFAHIRV